MHFKTTILRTSFRSKLTLSGKLSLATRNFDLFLELRKDEFFFTLIRVGVFLTSYTCWFSLNNSELIKAFTLGN